MDNSAGDRRRSRLGWAGFSAASRAYIVPWGFEDYARLPRAPFIDDPHLYPPPPGGTPMALWLPPRSQSAASPGRRVFLSRDYTSPGRRPRPIHGNVTFAASTRRRSKTCRDPFAASSITAQSRCNHPKRREFRLELAESRRSVPVWTLTGAPSGHRTRSKAGLIPVLPRGHGPTEEHSALGF